MLTSQYADLLGLELDDVKKASKAQKNALQNRFHKNCLLTSEIYYTDSHLIFTDKHTYENWQYYAGFEYVDNSEVDIIKIGRDFVAVYHDQDGRVSEVIDILLDIELTDEVEEVSQ